MLTMKPLVEKTVEDSESGHIYSFYQLSCPPRASGYGKQYTHGLWSSPGSQPCGSSLHLKDQRRSQAWQCIPVFLALEGLKHEDCLQVQSSVGYNKTVSENTLKKKKIRDLAT